VSPADADGVVRLAPRSPNGRRPGFTAGGKVRIVGGPLAGFDAIYTGGGGERAGIDLAQCARRAAPVEIAPGSIAPR
jgi:hypothetical protein